MRHHASIIFTHSKWKINVRCWALGLQVAWGLCPMDLQNLSLSFADDLYRKPALGEGHVVLQTPSSQSPSGSSQQLGSEEALGKRSMAAVLNRFKLPSGHGPIGMPVWRL